MIYQLKAYYGAVKDGVADFSVEFEIIDAKNIDHSFTIDEETIQDYMKKEMVKEGYDPNDYTFRWLTQAEYDNKVESVTEKCHIEA